MSRTATLYVTSGILLIIGVCAIFAAIAWAQVRVASRETAAHALQTGLRVAELVQSENLRDVGVRAERLAGNPAFAGYIAHALDTGFADDGKADLESLSDLLRERQRENGFDLIALLDLKGRTVAGGSGYLVSSNVDLSGNPIVAKAREKLVAATGSWVEQGGLHLIAVVPLQRGDTVVGLLLAGTTVGEPYVRKVAAASGADIAIAILPPAGPLVIATSLNPAQAQQLRSALPEFGSDSHTRPASVLAVRIDGHDDLAASVPASDGTDTVIMSLLPTRSGALLRALAIPLVLGASVIVAIILTGLFTLWRIWFAPLLRLLRAAELASRGDFRKDAEVVGTGPIAQLGVTVNVLMMKLRRHARAAASANQGVSP